VLGIAAVWEPQQNEPVRLALFSLVCNSCQSAQFPPFAVTNFRRYAWFVNGKSCGYDGSPPAWLQRLSIRLWPGYRCSVAGAAECNRSRESSSLKSEQIKEITEKAAADLIASLRAGHSQALALYLKAIARFHRYSLHNVLLIASQKPDASYVAGFRAWNQFGRFVRKGEKGITILAPIVRRKRDMPERTDESSRPILGFRRVFVFDLSQTEGQEMPRVGLVQGDPSHHTGRLREFLTAEKITIEYSEEIAPARGISFGGRITLLPGLPPAEEFSTLAHEVAHELLHRGERRRGISRTVRETEAEAVAFIVCSAIGLETGSAAADYIQLWNGDAATLLESLSFVQQAAARMLSALADGDRDPRETRQPI